MTRPRLALILYFYIVPIKSIRHTLSEVFFKLMKKWSKFAGFECSSRKEF